MNFIKEPYRLFFPLGTLLLICGLLVWVPLIWEPGVYPVLLHRCLMLNGFTGCFIAGFLMTAVPRFSQTDHAQKTEVLSYLIITLLGVIFAHLDNENFVFLFSSLQPLLLLIFLFSRISKRKATPPYSFVFIFVGLFLWFLSGVLSVFVDSEAFKQLHYEGAIAAIILGVGSRLIPGILGHVAIIPTQGPFKIPLHFIALIISFVGSYFLSDLSGAVIRAVVVTIIALYHWKLWKMPVDKTALTRCIWFSSWMIVFSFILKATWVDGIIHASHAFFINGIVLLSFMIGTRVLQSHGPKDKNLENLKTLYVVSFLVFVAAATRVSAFIMPDTYLHHLAYSAVVLVIGALLWSWKYLRYSKVVA